MFAMHLLSEVYYVNLPSVIAEDNTGAIFLSKNQQVGSRTKHIDVRHHFIQEKVDNGEIVVQYVDTCLNPADLLSKNVSQKVHDTHAKDMINGTMNCWEDNTREDVKKETLLLRDRVTTRFFGVVSSACKVDVW